MCLYTSLLHIEEALPPVRPPCHHATGLLLCQSVVYSLAYESSHGAGAAEAIGHAHADSNGAAEVKGEHEPKSSQEWVELLVQQMAGAKDLDDARGRASQILQAFEQAVLQQASQVGRMHMALSTTFSGSAS